jgi:hypothetical protein
MPDIRVNPGHFFKVRFKPFPGNKARIVVSASDPIDIYVVPDEDFMGFLSSHDRFTAKYPKQTNFETSLTLGVNSWKPWYLIFENSGTKVVRVDYEVYA